MQSAEIERFEETANGGEFSRECLIFDNDPAEDLADVLRTVRAAGFAAVHKRGLDELASYLEECVQGVRHPSIILLDVHIPNYPDLGLLGRPDLKLDSPDTAGTIIYEKILLHVTEIRDVPVIFISSHNNIAVINAFRFRKEGKKCSFVSKLDFPDLFESTLSQMKLKGRVNKTEIFSGAQFEQLWSGVCDYYRLKRTEQFTVLGLLPDSRMDFLNLLTSSADARERINVLIDIGICLRVLFGGNDAEWSAMTSDKLRARDGRTIREIIGRGDFGDLLQLRSRLEQLCGAK